MKAALGCAMLRFATICGNGGTGRRSRLRTCRAQALGGSNPSSRTTQKPRIFLCLKPCPVCAAAPLHIVHVTQLHATVRLSLPPPRKPFDEADVRPRLILVRSEVCSDRTLPAPLPLSRTIANAGIPWLRFEAWHPSCALRPLPSSPKTTH
jgi:hypothetical protein